MTDFRYWVLNDVDAFPSNATIDAVIDDNDWFDGDLIKSNCEWGVFPVENGQCFAFLFLLLWMNDELDTSDPVCISFDVSQSSVARRRFDGVDRNTVRV